MRDSGLDARQQAAQNVCADAPTTATKAPSDMAEELASQLFDVPTEKPTELPNPFSAAAHTTVPVQQHVGVPPGNQLWAPQQQYYMMAAPHAAYMQMHSIIPAQQWHPVAPPLMWYPQPAQMHAPVPTFLEQSANRLVTH